MTRPYLDCSPTALPRPNLMVPLDVVVQRTQESIAIHDTVHAVTEVSGSSVQVHTNLVNTSSVGPTTGQIFPVSGSQSTFLPDALAFGSGDVSALMQFVLRETYSQNAEDV